MNFKKTKKLVEKIDRLHTGMMDDGDDINSIERDLMLSYLRKMYDLFYESKAISKETTVRVEVPIPTPIKEVPREIPVKEIPKPVYTPPVPKPEPIQLEKEVKEINKEIAEVTKPSIPVVEKPVQVLETPKPTPPVTPPPVTTPPTPPVEDGKPKKFDFFIPSRSNPNQSVTNNNSGDTNESLFNDDSSGDLSDKLSNSPIRDLNKAFGLNDKLMYANQLFDGQNHIFKETIEVLNACNSFEQAKIYLIENVAKAYNWSSSD
ncbi:MAG: hypothetical protein ACPG5P_01805, partial [Saprospiraceae bacterium]